MQRKYRSFMWLAAVALGALLIAACSSGTEGPSNTVAATVNGKKIMLAEVERLINQQAQGKQSQFSAHDLAQARLQVLEKLIQREVLFQRAEQEKLLPTDEEITTSLNQQKQQQGMTDEEFARQLKEQSMTMEALREEAKKDLAINKLQEKYAGKVTISDREVEDYYNANKDKFVNERGVTLAVIIIDPADNSAQGITNDAKGDAEAKAKADSVYQQLKGGAVDFATVARSKSEDPQSLLKGGDIGRFSEDGLRQAGLQKELIDQFMSPTMAVGSITEPKLVNNRWYIFKLQDKRLQTENLTLESQTPQGSVRQQIALELSNQRKEILSAALLEVALNEAKIVNSLAAGMLSNPGNMGLRPASSEAAKPGTSPAAAAASPTTAPVQKAAASPASSSSPAKK
ncbi:MAG TPA: SurA N-terminal domain-containing protein [Pyrinomonadaceae bacterium]|nr:SurA N-terminal domain-containing protein [Pyrinomonadaceae bacterium]